MNSSVPNGSMVIERWCPEAAHRPTLDEAPVFYPSEEEFKDSLKYIASICQCVEPYGICRIVPPPSWNLPCTLKERTAWQTSKFATHVQKLDKLQNRDSTRKMANHDRNLAKRRRLSRMWVETGTSYGARENDLDCQKTREFGFELGPEFTLEAFQKYADDFKEKYFHLRSNQDDFQKQWEASVENIEEEYWRIVEMPTEEIEVLYGSDIETGAFGSGFPKSFTEAMNSDLVEKYVKSEWNLNNIARHPASMLAFESEDISGVILPWLYVGMCFSSFCWHVEDHHLYSLNYMHWGAPKIWYGVPGKDASKFEAAMRKHLPDLFEEQPDLLHKLVTQLSPSVLKSEAIPVYRCVQHPGEFVVTFPRAYHAGFSCGFNCAEAVNFAPIDWLPQGQRAVELYREQGRHTALSHDKLLLGAAREAVRAHWELQFLRKNTLNNLRWKDVCGKDGILTHALKKRVHMEQVQREYLSNPLKSMKMDVNFDEKIERECIVCHYDLHLSAVSCQCSPDSYACLTHAKQLCSCAWSMRSILFRYEINELNILLEALGGKLSAIHRWANLDLGLTLSSYVSRNKPEPDSIDKPLMEGAKLKEQALPIAINSNSISEKPRPCKEINVTMSRVSSSDVIESDQRRFNSTGTIVGPSPQKQDKNQLPSAYIHTIKGEVIGDNHVQDSSFSGHSIQSGEGALGSNSSSLSFQVCQLSREDTSYSKCIHGEGNSQESPALAPKDKHLSKSNLMESKVNIFLQSEAQSALKECDVRERAKLKEQALPTAINSNAISEKPRPCKEINVTMSQVSSSEVKESDQRRFNSTGTIVGPSPQKQDKNQLPSAYIHTRKGEVVGDNHVQDSSFSGPSIQSGEGALGSNSSSLSFLVCQLSQEDTSYSKCIHGEGNSQESPALAPKDKHLSESNLMASTVNIFLQSEAQSALKECDVRERAKLKEQALPTAINSNAISEKPRPCKEINVTMSRVSSSEVKESDQRRFNSTGTIVGPSPQKQDKNQLPSAYIHTRKGEVIGDNHVQDTSFSGPSIQSGEGALGSNSSSLSFQVCQLSREDSSYSKCIRGEGNSQESPALAPKDKHLSNSNLMASKVNILLQSEAQSALKECDVKDCGLNTHKSNASVMSERDANYVPVKDKVDHLLHHLQTTRGEIGAGEIGTNHCNVRRRPSYQNLSCNLTNNTPLENHVQDSALREPSHDNMTISARDLQRHQPQGNGRSFDVGINEMAGSCSNTERVQPVTRPRSRVNYCRRKVPYISNVVRRINYIATPLEYGSVVPGKLWSNSQVIFPKGFKSRVMYISVLDPAKMCYYISEILDAGLTRPVFMVSVEECPSEVFIHMSAAKCWDLVRERVNQEINKHNNLGRVNLPHMQPPGCINGLEMFGFSSSAIIQAIEAIDCKRICSEYWKCRPESRTKHHSVPVSCTRTLLHKLKEEPNHYPSTLLGALFKKANHEELQSMRSILVDNKRSSNYEALVQLLNTEIHSRQN